jgi:hypothetical protein
MRSSSRNKVAAFVSVLIAFAVVSSPAFAAKPDPTGIAPIDSRPYNKSYEQWAVEWWEWAYETPIENNPQYNSVGCVSSQKGDVWFLHGNFFRTNDTVRTCNLPANTALFFPISNISYSSFQKDAKETKTKESFLNLFQCKQSTDQVEAMIDGVAVPSMKSYFVAPHFFNAVKDVDHINAAEGYGDVKWKTSVDTGYYLFLYPLTSGPHTISWNANTTCMVNWPGQDSYPLVNQQSMVYNINVAP